MNFATRFLTTLAGIIGLNSPPPVSVPTAQPVRVEPGQIAKYLTRGGMPRRRHYVLPRLPNGESYVNTPDRRVCSADVAERLEADAQIRRARRAQSRLALGTTRTVLGESRIGFVHSPGLFDVRQRLDAQARRAERKALARGEIKP